MWRRKISTKKKLLKTQENRTLEVIKVAVNDKRKGDK
jgi:hypothetical protein